MKKEDFIVGKRYFTKLDADQINGYVYVGPHPMKDDCGVFGPVGMNGFYPYKYTGLVEERVLKSGTVWINIYLRADGSICSISNPRHQPKSRAGYKLLKSFELPWTEEITS